MNSNKITTLLLYLSIAIFLFGSGFKMGEFKTESTTRPKVMVSSSSLDQYQNLDDTSVDLDLLYDTWDKVEEKYVDKKKLDKTKMYYGAIKGLVAAIEDPYTFFLTPEENKQTKEDLGGKFEGIGAQLGLKDNKIVIVAPIKESPAEKAGIKAGDHVSKVNGVSTRGWTLAQTVSKIRGPKGSQVKLTIERSSKSLELSIVRDEIHVPSIELSYENERNCESNCKKVAVLKLNQFGENTNEEWDKTVDTIVDKWDEQEISGLVLDVRDNPGGYLEAAVYTSSEFLPKNKLVVKQESTKESESREYTVRRSGKLQDIPLVVLINQGSASASEILAGALRDYDRAVLIGEKSFGKGSVQEALDLKDGAGLHVTVAKWILPKGDWINGKGITPKIVVPIEKKEPNSATDEASLTTLQDKQLEKAIEEVVK